MHLSTLILFPRDSTWVKNGLDNFDVPMGGYDSSQIADLVGLYILDILTRIISPQQVGLYRDDGLRPYKQEMEE